MEKSTTDSTSTWSVKWKDEVTDSGKELTSGDLATKFPQINSKSKVQVEDNKAYWGFLDEGTEPKEQAKDPVKVTYK